MTSLNIMSNVAELILISVYGKLYETLFLSV